MRYKMCHKVPVEAISHQILLFVISLKFYLSLSVAVTFGKLDWKNSSLL